MVASRWPQRLFQAVAIRRSISASVRCSLDLNSAFGRRRGILTVRFTMAGGGLGGQFHHDFQWRGLMTVRNFSRTVLTCSMRQIAGRTMSVHHHDDRMAAVDNARLGTMP